MTLLRLASTLQLIHPSASSEQIKRQLLCKEHQFLVAISQTLKILNEQIGNDFLNYFFAKKLDEINREFPEIEQQIQEIGYAKLTDVDGHVQLSTEHVIMTEMPDGTVFMENKNTGASIQTLEKFHLQQIQKNILRFHNTSKIIDGNSTYYVQDQGEQRMVLEYSDSSNKPVKLFSTATPMRDVDTLTGEIYDRKKQFLERILIAETQVFDLTIPAPWMQAINNSKPGIWESLLQQFEQKTNPDNSCLLEQFDLAPFTNFRSAITDALIIFSARTKADFSTILEAWKYTLHFTETECENKNDDINRLTCRIKEKLIKIVKLPRIGSDGKFQKLHAKILNLQFNQQQQKKSLETLQETMRGKALLNRLDECTQVCTQLLNPANQTELADDFAEMLNATLKKIQSIQQQLIADPIQKTAPIPAVKFIEILRGKFQQPDPIPRNLVPMEKSVSSIDDGRLHLQRFKKF